MGAFLAKPQGLATVALLAIGIGAFGFYLWQKTATSGVQKPANTIGVLPFEVIGNENETDAMRKGLSDSLLFHLGKIRQIQVVPVKNYDSQTESEAIKIAGKSDAGSVLTGSLRQDKGQKIRVTIKLLEISTGNPLISETFDVKAEGTLESEKTVAVRIARKIDNHFAEIADRKFLETQNVSDEIKEKYLTGRHILRNFELNRRKEWLQLFKEIVEKEPKWATGHAKYVEALYQLQGLGGWEPETLEKAIEKALSLDKKYA